MSEFDQRQYRQMLYRLEDIERGAFWIATADFMILLDILEEPDGVMEIEVMIAIAAGEAEKRDAWDLTFDEETATRMRATAARLKQMVLAKIEPPADDSQDLD